MSAATASPVVLSGRKRSKGSLREWLVYRQDYGAGEVVCPHCTNGVRLLLSNWVAGFGEAAKYSTRCCTFCFKTSRIPEDFR